MSEARLWCPRCDQGWIDPIRVTPWGNDVYVCDECEALWRRREDVGRVAFEDFETFLEIHNMKAIRKLHSQTNTWSDFTIDARS
jgi:hypothetical protein